MISKPQQSNANGTDYVKSYFRTGNDLKTFLLQYSAFHCVFPFLPLASSVTANALFISHSVPFLPFYSFIPEILRNLCHSTTDCRNFSRKDTNNSWNYIRWMNYLRPAGDGCRHDRPNRRRQPAELSLRRGEGRARNLGFPSLELFNDYSSNSTEIQLANLRAISYGHRFRHNDPIGKRCRLHSSY